LAVTDAATSKIVTTTCVAGASTCVFISGEGSTAGQTVDAKALDVTATALGTPTVAMAFAVINGQGSTGSSTGSLISLAVAMSMTGFQPFNDLNGDGKVDPDTELVGCLSTFSHMDSVLAFDASGPTSVSFSIASGPSVTSNQFLLECVLPKTPTSYAGLTVSVFTTACKMTLSSLDYQGCSTCLPAMQVLLESSSFNVNWDASQSSSGTVATGSTGAYSYSLGGGDGSFTYAGSASYSGGSTTVAANGTFTGGIMTTWYSFGVPTATPSVAWAGAISVDGLASKYPDPPAPVVKSAAPLATPVAACTVAVVAAVIAVFLG